MQTLGRHDHVCALAEKHLDIVEGALADGIVSEHERGLILFSARRLKLANLRQAVRIRLGTRMIHGGELDREIMGELRDYQELVRQEKGSRAWTALKPKNGA